MFQIRINEELCIGCGDCTKTCPYMCFELEKISEKKNISRPSAMQEDCVACRSCITRCPSFAIDIIEPGSIVLEGI
jgi:NAD-dependent dihydropyrimidine dehydrogenase PreA subunit